MPTYDYQCTVCKKEILDHFKRMDDPDPKHCGEPMEQVFMTPRMFERSFLGSARCEGYHCVVTDQWVDSKRKRNEIIKREGLIERG